MDTDKTYAEQIAAEYAPKDTGKVVALRKLDRRAKLPATVCAYTLGIVGALAFGAGMCLSLGVIGNGSMVAMGGGVALGIVGLALAGINYPLYHRMLEAGKRRYAADIVRLAGEIAR